MISISDNEGTIIDFIIKNYSKRYTIREIALNLKISPAGAHKSLKKLGQAGIVKSEKLGTGLFYDIDYNNRAARHLACFIISQTKDYSLGELKELVKAVIVNKHVLVVSDTHDHSKIRADVFNLFKDKEIMIMTEEEFRSGVMRADKKITDILGSGSVAYGEELLIKSLRGFR
ncbi:winged helix-turn-helix transcriptional regulator [Candidatus Woesearchaeota archaeon]|nr:winged helix-turn-helix transcriptional regulator [Candidatus Woesearchaeota archaeon]